MLLWIGVSAFAVLVGAAVNAAIDRVWPAAATAAAREANERLRQAQVAEYVARTTANGEGDPDMPSEFPERWSRFLPPRTSRPVCAPTRRARLPRTTPTITTTATTPPEGRAKEIRAALFSEPPHWALCPLPSVVLHFIHIPLKFFVKKSWAAGDFTVQQFGTACVRCVTRQVFPLPIRKALLWPQ